MRPLLLASGLAGLSAVGCAVPSPDPPDAEAASASAAAIVVVERTSGPGETVRGDAVVARFVRVRQGSLDDSALRIAGVAQDLPPLNTCAAPADATAAAQAAAGAQPRGVDLLDVGPVSLDATQGKSTVLLPRAMPDPAGVVSGVFYSARSTEAFTPGSRLLLRANGGPDLLDGFSVSMTSPRDVGDVLVTSTASGLDVTWEPGSADDGDLVYVDVLAPHVLVRCATLDTGRLIVPPSTMLGVDEGNVAVHRVHRETFRARGIDPGEVRFDVARVVGFRR